MLIGLQGNSQCKGIGNHLPRFVTHTCITAHGVLKLYWVYKVLDCLVLGLTRRKIIHYSQASQGHF
jgi:hypothetical protein